MRRKVSWPGVFLVLAAVCLVAGTFIVMTGTAFRSLYLNEEAGGKNGWEYEVRTDSGEARRVSPEYVDEYNFVLYEGAYDAVKQSRMMTEQLAHASLQLDYSQCGIELFLDDRLFYSDFRAERRDKNGYLLPDETDFDSGEWRSISIGLPKDYAGKKLTMIIYYPETVGKRYGVYPHLQSMDTILAGTSANAVMPMLWVASGGSILVGLAFCCLVSLSRGRFIWKQFILLLISAASFCISAYHSPMGHYSGLQGWLDQILGFFSADIAVVELVVAVAGAVLLLFLELLERKKRAERVFAGRIILYVAIGFLITAMQNSVESEVELTAYFSSVIRMMSSGLAEPFVKLCSSVVICTVAFLTVERFVKGGGVLGWREKAGLLEQGRFAAENYELIVQADESSRRRNHEMKHHLQTTYSLLQAQETEKAADYIGKVLKDATRLAEMTYSENTVLNAIVGIRLNEAKKRGIAVQCQIYVPEILEMDHVDLSVLLSNMIENAQEACMRMECFEDAYIRLEIRKRKQFLYIECENSVDLKENPEQGCRTIKADRKNHGYGLGAMEAVAEKYSGILQIEREEGRFLVRTNLCLARENRRTKTKIRI